MYKRQVADSRSLLARLEAGSLLACGLLVCEAAAAWAWLTHDGVSCTIVTRYYGGGSGTAVRCSLAGNQTNYFLIHGNMSYRLPLYH